MKDTIYTIPVSEVFEPKEGCPLCRMRDTLEERCLEYIMGAAMMEPDVRQDTNRQGFCTDHFRMMLTRKNRLSLGLMLQSHLDYIRQEVVGAKAPILGKDKRLEKAREVDEGCYVCARIDWAMERMLDTILGLWQKEEAFRTLFSQQECICFPHYRLLAQKAQEKLPKKALPGFLEVAGGLTLGRLEALKGDVDRFCNLFDYRNAAPGPIPEEVRSSIERSISYLCARQIGDK